MAEKLTIHPTEVLTSLGVVEDEIKLQNSSDSFGGFVRFSGDSLLLYDPSYFVTVEIPNLGIQNSTVPVLKLFEVMKKFGEDEVECWTTDKEFRVQKPGGRKKCGLVHEVDPFPEEMKETPKPTLWWELNEESLVSMNLCCEIARQARRSDLECVQFTREHIEATDNFRILRSPAVSPAEKRTLYAPPEVLSRIIKKSPTEIGVSKDWEWLLFRGKSPVNWKAGARLVRIDEYPNMDAVLSEEGEALTLPQRVADILNRSEIFSSGETKNSVRVRIFKGEILFRSEGAEGWLEEKSKIRYEGKEAVEFLLNPILLKEVIALQGTQAILCKKSIRFETEGGRILAASLAVSS